MTGAAARHQCEMQSLRIYAHTAGEIWGLAPCPSDRGILASVHTKVAAARGCEQRAREPAHVSQGVCACVRASTDRGCATGALYTVDVSASPPLPHSSARPAIACERQM